MNIVHVAIFNLFVVFALVFCGGFIQSEYSFYWLISDAGLPSNISVTCANNATLAECDVYTKDVVQVLARYGEYSALCSFGTGMVGTIIGTVSDVIGRKKVLVANKLGYFISIIVCTFITYYHLHPYYFLIPSTIWNLVGGYSVMLGVTFATVTSYSPDEKRFWYIVAADVGISIAGLTVTGIGYLINTLPTENYYMVIAVGAAVMVIPLFLAIFGMKENVLPPEIAALDKLKKCFSDIKEIWFRRSHLNKFLWLVVLVPALDKLVSFGTSSVTNLYLQSAPFAWDPEELSMYISASSLLGILSFILPGVFRHFGISSFAIIYLSLLMNIGRNIMFGKATSTVMIMCTLGFNVLTGSYIPVIRNLLAMNTEKHNHGAVFAFLAALEANCITAGGLLYSYLYHEFPVDTSWLFWLLSPAIGAIGFVFAICAHFVYVEKIKFAEDQRCLINENDDSASESFSEFDGDQTPLD